MPDSTTLMTFLVRAPPSTRSVTLMGSWDNFSKPYPMKRDPRVGPEHWTGCHSFENIVCDGDLGNTSQARDGGLKMGGTYWYYYKLDDDIEFHNSAETSTTSCPMMPGQLVNVLHVPLYLSGHRRRNDSMSSTSSNNRTMNPSDKYLNPRPVPKRSLPRLNTSPSPHLDPVSATSMTISPWSGLSPAHREPASQPASATSLRKFRLPRKASVDGRSRSVSPHSKMSGLRAKFGSFKLSRPVSPDHTSQSAVEPREMDWNISGPIMHHRVVDNRSLKSHSTASSTTSSTQGSPQPTAEIAAEGSYFSIVQPEDVNAEFEETATPFSLQKHRRQRSRSREPSNLWRSLNHTENDETQESILNITTLAYHPLETLREVQSTQNTPTLPVTATRLNFEHVESPLKDESLLEKRLPTLPNTPSSAYPPSMYFESPAKSLDQQIEGLQSHFSISTTDSVPRSGNESHFSAWTISTKRSSRDSDYSLKDSEYDNASVHDSRLSTFSMLGSPFESKSAETLVPQHRIVEDSEPLVNTASRSTFSSTLSTSPSSPESESFEFEQLSINPRLEHVKPRPLGPGHVQAYRLPDVSPTENGPLTCVNTTPQDRFPPHGLDFTSPLNSEFDIPPRPIHKMNQNELGSTLAHSESMQQLLQELNYLGDLIQN